MDKSFRDLPPDPRPVRAKTPAPKWWNFLGACLSGSIIIVLIAVVLAYGYVWVGSIID